jgi:hypothetical protein
MIISVFFATITEKCGVWCKTKCNLWFYAKESPTTGVMCYFLHPVEAQKQGVARGIQGSSTQVLCLVEKEEKGQICTKAPGFGGFYGILKIEHVFV